MLRLLPSAAHGLGEVLVHDLLAAGEVTGGDLRVDLDPRVWRDEVIWQA